MKLSDQVADLERRLAAYRLKVDYGSPCRECEELRKYLSAAEERAEEGVARYLKLRRQVERNRTQVIDRLANLAVLPSSWPSLTIIRDLLDAMTDPKYLGSS